MCGIESIEAEQTGVFAFLNEMWNALILVWNNRI